MGRGQLFLLIKSGWRAPSFSTLASCHHFYRVLAAIFYSTLAHRASLPPPPAGGFLNFEANAKWDAHAALKGMAPAEAKEKYIAEVARQQREYA